MKKIERKINIMKDREKGYTYQKIADKYSLSKQRIHQIITGYSSPVKKRVVIKDDKLNKLKTYQIENPFLIGHKKVLNMFIDKIEKNQHERPIEQWLYNMKESTGINCGGREQIRELIRKRDNHTCQWCGKKWQKGERRFDIHHIFGEPKDSRRYDWDTAVQITLCHQCHLNIDAHKMRQDNMYCGKPV